MFEDVSPWTLCSCLQEEGGLVDVETVEDMTQTMEELRKSVSGVARSIW